MGIILGLAASLSYGIADFLGGLTARRVPSATVVLVSQAAGLLALLAFVPLFLGDPLSGESAMWSAVSGLVGAIGIVLLYRGLAIGRMSVVAPISAVLGATVPVAFGLATGESPTGVQLAGVAVALVAVALVSMGAGGGETETGGRRGLPEAVGAGLAFGVFFLTFNEAGDASGGVWPLVTARVTSVTIFAAVALLRRRPLRVDREARVPLLAVGVLDVVANLCFLAGSRIGVLPVVAVLTSLYPATTVLLARTVLRERMSPAQVGGLGGALAGIALITAGG